MLERFLDWLAHLPTFATYCVLAVLSSLENVFPPVPADVAVALGAFLAQRGEVSAPLLGFVCWTANQASAVGVYLWARSQGPAFLEHRLTRALMPPAAQQLLREAYERHGVAGIFLSRFLPGLRAGVLPFAGLVGLSPLRALLPCALASGIWYALLIVAGSALGLNWPAVRALVEDASRLLGVAAALATLGLTYWLWKRTRQPPRP